MVKVITDSTAVVPADLAASLRLTTVPVWLHFEDRSHRDGVDVDQDELYRRLVEGARVTTSSPSPGDFLNAFRDAAATGFESVFVTTVSRELSAIHTAARAAADAFDALPVRVFDSQTAVTGAGLVALEAGRAAAAGAGIAEVEEAAHRVAKRTRVAGMVDSLRWLRRSGRVNAAKYWAGSVLRVKPMFQLRSGSVRPGGAARSVESALEKMAAMLEGKGQLHAGVFHAAAPDRAAQLRDKIVAAEPGAETLISRFSSAMGAHTGPGVVGVGWWRS